MDHMLVLADSQSNNWSDQFGTNLIFDIPVQVVDDQSNNWADKVHDSVRRSVQNLALKTVTFRPGMKIWSIKGN
jgi:hypothetical protein